VKAYQFKYGSHTINIPTNMMAEMHTETISSFSHNNPILTKVTLTLYAYEVKTVELGEFNPGDKDYDE